MNLMVANNLANISQLLLNLPVSSHKLGMRRCRWPMRLSATQIQCANP